MYFQARFWTDLGPIWVRFWTPTARRRNSWPRKKIHAWIFLRGQLFLQLAVSTHPSRQLGQPKSFMQKVFLFCKPQKRAPFENLGPFFCKQQLGYCLAPDKPKDDHPTSLVRKIWTPSKRERKQENFRFRWAITSKTARETPSTKLCKHVPPNGGRRCLAVGDCNQKITSVSLTRHVPC